MATQLSPEKPVYWESFTLAHGPLQGIPLKTIGSTPAGILELWRLAFGNTCFWIKSYERHAIRKFLDIPQWEVAVREALEQRSYKLKRKAECPIK